ncbi:FkbM family methyltransferase [Yoonia sp. 208BN28-4]|uniref:FkbM family methyltransferase n=1 Tax=Yoonia sp. 208BN28-4 TaxID=3126505 RepID=UPI0030B2ADF6
MSQESLINAARQELIAAHDALVKELAGDKTRKRGALNRQVHEVRQMLDRRYTYASQAGQDVVVDRVFDRKRGGTFVDVGGYDGVTGSNSIFFEQWRGWTGVLVEPVAQHLEHAMTVRRCPCLGYAVAPTDGEAEFIAVTKGFTQMSGLSDSYDPKMLERVRADPRHAETVLKVPTKTLSSILNEAGIVHPDFVSLDIEGGELSVLEGFNFLDHRVGAWAIENNSGTPDIAKLMNSQGYELIELCGPDEIYIRRNH